MTIHGHIENGQVILDGPLSVPDGTKITVLVKTDDAESQSPESLPSLYDRLKHVAGKAKDLPTDLASNHDHYLHGQPKRQ